MRDMMLVPMMEKMLRKRKAGFFLHGRNSSPAFVDMVLASFQYSAFTWPEIFWGQIFLSPMMVELCP